MDVLLAKRLQQQRTPRLFRRALRAAEEFDFDVDNVELAQRYVKACKDLQGVFAALDERFLPLDASGPGRIRAFLYEEAADAAAASNSPLSPPRRSQDSLPSSPPETPDTFLSAGSASAGCRGDFPESSSGQAGEMLRCRYFAVTPRPDVWLTYNNIWQGLARWEEKMQASPPTWKQNSCVWSRATPHSQAGALAALQGQILRRVRQCRNRACRLSTASVSSKLS